MKHYFLLLKQIHVLLLLSLLMIASCKKDDNPPCACGVENPQDNLEWLRKDQLDKRFYTEIYSISFQGNEYIGVADYPNNPDWMIVFYDCNGNNVCEWGGIIAGGVTCNLSNFTWNYFQKNKKLIYIQTENPYFN